MGAHFRSKELGQVGTEDDIGVAQIVPHSKYNITTKSYDILLLRLARPAKLGKGVGLACLANCSIHLPDNKTCWVTGWGTLKYKGKHPDVLMQAQVPIAPRQRCLMQYRRQIDVSMRCAGYEQGDKDACGGDSGGPLVCEFNSTWYLEGVTSWGRGCAVTYGVYADVRHLEPWIQQMMNPSKVYFIRPIQ